MEMWVKCSQDIETPSINASRYTPGPETGERLSRTDCEEGMRFDFRVNSADTKSEVAAAVPVPHQELRLWYSFDSQRAPMQCEFEFEVYYIDRRGVRTLIGKSQSFGEIVVSAITLAAQASGRYSVSYVQNPAIPIFELKMYNGIGDSNLLSRVNPSGRNFSMGNERELEDTKESFPTHEEIEKRAYELYRQAGDEGTAIEYWLIAEAELKRGYAKGPSASLKKKAATGS